MNIAFITIGFAPFRSAGIDIISERLVMSLLDRNNSVTVISGQKEAQPEVISHPDLRIVRIPLDQTHWIGFGLRAARTLRKLERETAFDIIHFWDIYFAWAYWGQFIGTLHHSFKQRISTSSNVNYLKKLYYLIAMIFAERPSIQRASGLLAVSDTSMQAYINDYQISSSKVMLTTNGIDTQFFHPVKNTEGLRSRLKIPNAESVIMYSGFFTPRKGLEYLAQAIREMDPKPWLVITGKLDQSFQEKFFSLLGPAKTKVIYAGFVPDDQMPDYFSMADLYVSTSLLEGFGLPLAEALACGTPVITANVGAVEEVVGPGGVLVPPGDSHALAQAVMELLLDPQRRDKLGRRGRKHIENNFSLENMTTAYLKAYKIFKSKCSDP